MNAVDVFRFIDAEKTSFPIAFMCHRLGVSTAGYYAWLKRPPSARSIADAHLTATIQQIHARSRGTYGVPRIHAELGDEHGVHCGRKRVARLMRIAQLRGVCHRRRVRTTRRDEQAQQLSDDLVQRLVSASQPNALWCADITYLPTWQGFLYLVGLTHPPGVGGESHASTSWSGMLLRCTTEGEPWHVAPPATSSA